MNLPTLLHIILFNQKTSQKGKGQQKANFSLLPTQRRRFHLETKQRKHIDGLNGTTISPLSRIAGKQVHILTTKNMKPPLPNLTSSAHSYRISSKPGSAGILRMCFFFCVTVEQNPKLTLNQNLSFFRMEFLPKNHQKGYQGCRNPPIFCKAVRPKLAQEDEKRLGPSALLGNEKYRRSWAKALAVKI